MDLAVGAATTVGLSYAGYSYLCRHRKVEVNCWFCNQNSKVLWPKQNDFVCPHCQQYNGFTNNGDYAKSVDQFDNLGKRYCVTAGQAPDVIPSNDNGLCGVCNAKQEIIVEKLANFEPTSEQKFNEEYDTYKYKLDQMYPLCSDCSVKTHQKLQHDKMAYRHLLDVKYKLFPVIKSGLRHAGRLTANLVKRRRRHFFAGGSTTVMAHMISLFLSCAIFIAHFNFLQEDTDVVFVSFPTPLRLLFSHLVKWSCYLTMATLVVHFTAMHNNQSRGNFPDLLLPLILLAHETSYLLNDSERREDFVLFRCGISALAAVMALIVAIVPRKAIHQSKPNRVLTSAFSVASTPVSQCSSQNVTILESSLIRKSSPFSDVSATTTPKLTKQVVRERFQWREREQTPDRVEPRPRKFLLEQINRTTEEMDWEPSPAPSVISLSSFHQSRQQPARSVRETTPSRFLAGSLSGLSIVDASKPQRRSNFSTTKSFFGNATELRAPSTAMTSASQMRSLHAPRQQEKDDSPRAESIFTSVSQHSRGSSGHSSVAPNNYGPIITVIVVVLFFSVAFNMVTLYFAFYNRK